MRRCIALLQLEAKLPHHGNNHVGSGAIGNLWNIGKALALSLFLAVTPTAAATLTSRPFGKTLARLIRWDEAKVVESVA